MLLKETVTKPLEKKKKAAFPFNYNCCLSQKAQGPAFQSQLGLGVGLGLEWGAAAAGRGRFQQEQPRLSCVWPLALLPASAGASLRGVALSWVSELVGGCGHCRGPKLRAGEPQQD